MSEIKLLPCPFCGEEVELIEYKHREYASTYAVNCKGYCVKQYAYRDVDRAIEAWNTRKPMDDIVEQLEKEFKKYYGNKWDKAPYLVKAIDIVRNGGKG